MLVVARTLENPSNENSKNIKQFTPWECSESSEFESSIFFTISLTLLNMIYIR